MSVRIPAGGVSVEVHPSEERCAHLVVGIGVRVMRQLAGILQPGLKGPNKKRAAAEAALLVEEAQRRIARVLELKAAKHLVADADVIDTRFLLEFLAKELKKPNAWSSFTELSHRVSIHYH
jgi:hypothetical protein